MRRLQVPGTDLIVVDEGSEWWIYRNQDGKVILFDSGVARTRFGMKFAVLRRIAPLMFKDEHHTHATTS
jgi:hypothetical protein